ncbi:MAG: 1-acyl-sn-glycerol-3-phosphate acyltransferase [Micromonosporaceae bacterium]
MSAPRVLVPLARRMANARREAASQRDPGFISRLLPTIGWYTGYFSPEVRGLDRLPATGPALVVGNHSCLFYVPEAWVTARAIIARRGIEAPLYMLAYDLLFAIPGVESVIRRLGAVPAGTEEAQSALEHEACVLVYPGGDWEACRPWTERNRVDFAGRKGFVRLALRCGIPVVPVVAHGSHHAVVVVTRGDRLARAVGLHGIRIKVFPFLAGFPFGVASVLTPPLPMPAQVTVEFLPALDWSRHGPGAEHDDDVVAACYDEITGLIQAALDRLNAERPHPVLDGSARLAARAASIVRRVPSGLWPLRA